MAGHRYAGELGDGAAFTVGAMRQLAGSRVHMVLNSLSNDFTTMSFAMLRERGCFQEIGKRGV